MKRFYNCISFSRRRVASLLLAVCTVWGGLAGGFVREIRAENGNAVLDFAAFLGQTATAPQGDIVSGLIGEGISKAEREFLNKHSKYSVLYTSDVPKDHCVAAVVNGRVCAIATPYSYTAANGQTVNWVPAYVKVNGSDAVPLVWSDKDGAYCAYLDGGSGLDVEFTYMATVTLPDDIALDMANEAYLAAVDMAQALAEFEESHRVWSEKNDRYQAYKAALEEYTLAKEAHKKYLDDLAEYDSDCLAYQAWWDAYDAQKDLHDQYVLQYDKFTENQDAIKRYDDLLEAYREYMDLVNVTPELKAEYEAKIIVASGQLDVVNSFYRGITPKNRSFYSVITSSLVDMVIANKAEIETLGGRAEDVDNAERASYYLGKIFGEYDALATDADRYAYAFESMNDIKAYLTMLRSSLENLANVTLIMNRIVAEGLKDEFFEFMGIMYYCECAVYNEKTFDDNANYKGVSMRELLDISALATDGNSLIPLDGGWPLPPTTADDVTPVEHPGIRPTPMDEPEFVAPPPDTDEAPSQPVEPDFVDDPGDTPPDEVTTPGDEPTPPETDEAEKALLVAYSEGKIIPRKNVSSSATQVSACTTVRSKTVRMLVSVYDGDRFLSEFYVVFGGSAEGILPSLPNKTVNGREYEFIGWSLTPNGVPIDVGYLSCVAGAMSLHAVYDIMDEPTETDTDTETETVTETETEAETETETKTEAPTETETQTETETEVQTEISEETTSRKEETTPLEEETLDLSVPKISLWATLLGKIGLVPLLIIGGAFVGAIIASSVIVAVVLIDKKRR